jgi:hypothetical protein
MLGRVALKRALVALWCLAAVGCANVTDDAARDAATAEAAATAAEPAAMATAPAAARDAGTPDSALSAPVASPAADRQDSIGDSPAPAEAQLSPPAVPTADLAPAVSSADLAPAALERPVVGPAGPASREPERESDLVAHSVASPPSAETLDFTSLVTRLRKTKAINLRTKVAVKNESDDLLARFRAYHAQHGTATLAELRRSYDALFLKLYALLEDADPPLARDIDRSRAAIWAFLADPMKFGASAPTVATRRVPPA